MSASTTSAYHHYVNSVSPLQKELKECISEVERIGEASRFTDSKKKDSLMKEEKKERGV